MAKCTKLIDAEAAKEALEKILQSYRRTLSNYEKLGRTHQSHIYHSEGLVNGMEAAVAIISALPDASEGRQLDPEALKEALRESLCGCGPMAAVYAEATVNAMAGIESPRQAQQAGDGAEE